MLVKRITWSVDSVATGRFFFTLYGNGMEMKVSRDLSAGEMNKAFGAMHSNGFVVLPQQ